MFHVNKNKIIPEDIFNLLNPIALAHWISGDGQIHRRGLRLCTDSYSIQDIVKLMNVLIIRYELECTYHKFNNRIYIKQKSMFKLINLIIPNIHPSLHYKLNLHLLTKKK
jgi:hypothetical protein